MASSQVFLAASVLVILFISNGVNATDVCGATDAGPEKNLCTNLVKGAKTWNEALTNVVHTIMDEAKKSKPLIEGLPQHLPPTLLAISKDSIVKTCNEAYENVLDNLNKVLENLRTGDPMGSIDVELSATLDAFGDCTDGLNEFGVDDPSIDKARDVIQKYSSISLAITSTKRRH